MKPFYLKAVSESRMRLQDYGLGSFVGVDGTPLHTPGNLWGHLAISDLRLTAGDHSFETLGMEVRSKC